MSTEPQVSCSSPEGLTQLLCVSTSSAVACWAERLTRPRRPGCGTGVVRDPGGVTRAARTLEGLILRMDCMGRAPAPEADAEALGTHTEGWRWGTQGCWARQ